MNASRLVKAVERVRRVLSHENDCSHTACAPTCLHAIIDAALTAPAEDGAFNEEAERQQATDALARECFDGPTPSAREADLWIEGWLMRARYAHPTPAASAHESLGPPTEVCDGAACQHETLTAWPCVKHGVPAAHPTPPANATEGS